MNAEQVIWSMTFFAILLIPYGVSAGSPQTNAVGNLLAPLPPINSLFAGKQNCAWYDLVCNGQNVAQATENIAAAISYPFVIIFIIVARLFGFGTFLGTTFTGPTLGAAAVPFLPIVMAALVLIVGFEIVRIVRGNASAGTL